MNDQAIINAILSGGYQAEQAIQQLFDANRGLVGQGIKKHQLSESEVLDAYTDAIMGLRKQVLAGKFRGESKLSTFLYTIFYRRCVDLIRKKATHSVHIANEYPEIADTSQNLEAKVEIDERFQQLRAYMQELGEVCQKILMYRYFWGYEDMEEIASLVGVKNANTAGSLRYRCMKQLMKIIDHRAHGS